MRNGPVIYSSWFLLTSRVDSFLLSVSVTSAGASIFCFQLFSGFARLFRVSLPENHLKGHVLPWKLGWSPRSIKRAWKASRKTLNTKREEERGGGGKVPFFWHVSGGIIGGKYRDGRTMLLFVIYDSRLYLREEVGFLGRAHKYIGLTSYIARHDGDLNSLSRAR